MEPQEETTRKRGRELTERIDIERNELNKEVINKELNKEVMETKVLPHRTTGRDRKK